MSEIKTTIGALLNAEPILDRLCDDRALSNQAASHARKLRRLAREETQLFREKRDFTIKELGDERAPTPDEAAHNGGQPIWEVTPVNRAEFFKRMNDVAAVSVEIAWKPLTLSELSDVRLSGNEQDALGALLAEDAEQK